MRACLGSVLFLICISATAVSQDRLRVVRAVIAGMECKQTGASAQLNCEYSVGKDLRFAIAGVGQEDAGITF